MDSNKFKRCWACGNLCKDNGIKHYKRIEYHHIWGEENNDAVIPLCLICHDLIDRCKTEDTFEEFIKALPQINALIRNTEDIDGKYKNLKLLMLKFLKMALYHTKMMIKK